ncbi:hypothetical protein MUK42_32529 [Musa troglodytarum]|uniref:Uncharacterized protein n=1 Tax=Musa troglodytarum TaxID=320322 RepID=A0A9E7FFH6_9LILI|nr:hypothetical protein MUK42_32529 [Musa troglodytarum]
MRARRKEAAERASIAELFSGPSEVRLTPSVVASPEWRKIKSSMTRHEPSNRESSGSPFFVHFSIRFKCFLF